MLAMSAPKMSQTVRGVRTTSGLSLVVGAAVVMRGSSFCSVVLDLVRGLLLGLACVSRRRSRGARRRRGEVVACADASPCTKVAWVRNIASAATISGSLSGSAPSRCSTSATIWSLCCSDHARCLVSSRGSRAASSTARANRSRPIDGSRSHGGDEVLEVGQQMARGAAGRERRRGRRVERRGHVAQHGVVLGLEVVEEGPRGDARLGADRLDRDGVDPVLLDEPVRRVDERLTALALLALAQPVA